MASLIEDIKTAAELLEKAAELLREAAKAPSLPSEAERRSTNEAIMRIRLKLMLMRRDITILHGVANRRKPRVRESREKGDDV